MLIVLWLLVIVVIAGAVFVALGRGGGLSVEHPDYVPLDLGPVTATDVDLLRPPAAMWGYHMQSTDEAMAKIADSIRERDVRIVALEQLVSDLARRRAPTETPVPTETPRPAETLLPSVVWQPPGEQGPPARTQG